MGLGVPVEFCVGFLKQNRLWAKMTKIGQEVPQNWKFSTILKDFVISVCLKH